MLAVNQGTLPISTTNMAALLKMPTFRFATLAIMIVFGSVVAVYVKRKIGSC